MSFVGHSLGGLIIRATLPLLQDYCLKMHFFLSLSAPHLGFLENSYKHIDLGLYFMRMIKKNISIK